MKTLAELEKLVEEINKTKSEPARLGLTDEGEYPLFTVIREFAKAKDEALYVRAAKLMTVELRRKQCFSTGWQDNLGGRKNVMLALQVASWDKEFESLQLCPLDQPDPPFLAAAVEELARSVR